MINDSMPHVSSPPKEHLLQGKKLLAGVVLFKDLGHFQYQSAHGEGILFYIVENLFTGVLYSMLCSFERVGGSDSIRTLFVW